MKTATYDPPATSRLRWQPVGARVVRSAGQSWAINEVMPTAAISPLPADPPASVSTRAAGDPFNDPFEDHRAVAADSRAASDPFKDPFGDHPPAKVPATATAAPEPLGTASATAESQRLPTIQESVKRKAAPADKCPSPGDFKSICAISADISENKGDMPPECGLGDLQFRPRCWGPKTYTWTASGLCHKPLYFEDVQLERYGHSYGPLLQPLISPAEFFLTFPVLPYKMGLTPPNECMYALGYYRPGDCAPYMFDAIPISVRASLFEAAAWTGAIAAVP